MDREAVRRLAEARAEIVDLRAENTRLRVLLGLETRRGDGHRRAWAPTLLSQPATVSPIDAAAPIERKLALVRSLFGARTDVFATRWENASSGRSGWSPAVRGGWRRTRAGREYLRLDDEVLARHLRGETTIGIYPLLPDDTCCLLPATSTTGAGRWMRSPTWTHAIGPRCPP